MQSYDCGGVVRSGIAKGNACRAKALLRLLYGHLNELAYLRGYTCWVDYLRYGVDVTAGNRYRASDSVIPARNSRPVVDYLREARPHHREHRHRVSLVYENLVRDKPGSHGLSVITVLYVVPAEPAYRVEPDAEVVRLLDRAALSAFICPNLARFLIAPHRQKHRHLVVGVLCTVGSIRCVSVRRYIRPRRRAVLLRPFAHIPCNLSLDYLDVRLVLNEPVVGVAEDNPCVADYFGAYCSSLAVAYGNVRIPIAEHAAVSVNGSVAGELSQQRGHVICLV